MSVLEELITSFSALPGLGKKTAARIVYHLLKTSPQYCERFGSLLTTLHESVNYCGICNDDGRDKTIVCVVEEPQDVATFLSLPDYAGVFHVLGGAISPLHGVNPDSLNIASLVERVKEGVIKEVILATNPTLEGDTTALYIQNQLRGMDIKITRLAFGLPVGGELEYVDRQTLSRSLSGRLQF